MRSGLACVVVVAAAALVFGAAGCSIDPYCITCQDGSSDAGDASDGIDGDVIVFDQLSPDGTEGGPDADAGEAGDTGPHDACLEEELCNGEDDDCDGNTDEGIDTATDERHCGGCNMPCSPDHAFGECVDSECHIGSCAVGRHDLNVDPEDGCEYRCLASADEDTLCDRRDNDCDGDVDEDVSFVSDPLNCGSCGRACRFAHAVAACTDSECEIEECDDGYWDLNGSSVNGCEYACTAADPATEVCNRRDDDCDGEVDEGNPGGGVSCGTEDGECSTGTTLCTEGNVVCVGEVAPTGELCNGLDDDCDGDTDESDPEGGGLCGSGLGTCQQGREHCVGGDIVCQDAVGPGDETCDGLDNNCNGTIDDGNPDGGADCGINAGACEFGTLNCRGGALVCEGGTGATDEECNAADDDCDGSVDENNPEGGAFCGTDVGQCSPGTTTCTASVLECIGAVAGNTEQCNGLDDNCDGVIDDGNPEGGATCGIATGECSTGTEICLGGVLVCTGGDGAELEECDGLDNDCDGATDEDFDLDTDINNCGACGNDCNLANAISTCDQRDCKIVACLSGWHDEDANAATGCEYQCDFNGADICNGLDDDCDGTADESLTPPSFFCNANGVCSGTTASCDGAAGWACHYSATNHQVTETRCDGLDNDCDGATDEPFPLKGTACSQGVGECRTTGTYVCMSDQTNIECSASAPGTPGTEACDDRDNDCDGSVDEALPLSALSTVEVNRPGGGTMRIMAYEASRPDATGSSAGSASTVACSRTNVVPWANVTLAKAQDACCALNAGGACPGAGVGWRLCSAAEWESACEGPAGTCDWSYASSCSTSSTVTCNGMEYDCSGTAGDQDCLFTTGSSTFTSCYTDWTTAGRVYDLSGNLREWTATAAGGGFYQTRGGSYNSIEVGRACDFDFTVGDGAVSYANTGFRCCYY